MKVLARSISHFGPVAWSGRRLPDDKSRAKGSLPAATDRRLVTSPSGEANAQAVGKRTSASIVKRAPAEIAGRAGVNREGEPVFDGRSPQSAGKQMGTRTCRTDGVKGGGMRGRTCQSTGEAPCGPVERRVRPGISPTGESPDDAARGVGDGHSTDDGRDRITRPEERAVSLKTPSAGGGARVIAQKASSTPQKRVRVLQRRLCASAKANPKRRYANLYDKACRMDVLKEAWRRVSKKGGSAGVDGKSIQWIRAYGVTRYLQELRQALRTETHRPSLIRRTHIPKPDGRQRPLGIPTVTDRVVQTAVKLAIEPIFEADFQPNSYGFRPKRSSHQAIHRIDALLRRGRRWVVDVDLQSYFDTIPHERLLTLVSRRISDRKVLRLIRRWLKAGVLEDGEVQHPELGSPQGGVLSPLLSNIYLHELDVAWSKRGIRTQLIRYADDMLILCPTEADAQRAYRDLQAILEELELTLNTEKTRVTAARDGFDFLGFSFRRGEYTRNGKRREIIIKVPRSKAETSLRRKIKAAVKSVRLGESVAKAVQAANARLRGWAVYFKIGNMYHALKGLVRYACSQLRLFLRRKHQRKDTTCERRWPDRLFHEHFGLSTVADLNGRRRPNVA